MRIFVAGGTGAIGRPLVSALLAAGHEVTVFSRSADRVAALGLPGVVPAIGDALHPDDVTRSVQLASPEVVINQLTNLAQSANPLAVKRGFDQTSRLRREASGSLVAAARAVGARRVIAQSISFIYRPGPGVRTEADPLWTEATGQIGQLAGSVATLESATLGDEHVEGVVLHGPIGVFNVVDDVPAPASEWMPFVARLLGAKPPHRVPESIARVGAGKFLAYLMCDQPAVSNERARTELAWSPRYPDWHEGLRQALAGR